MSFKDYLLQESINDKGTFKCLFITSSPLAGKSYTIERIKGGNFPVRIVNTDIATEYFAKKFNVPETDAYGIVGGERIKTVTKNILFHTLNGALPMVVDGTSADENNLLKRKGIVEGLGYDTAMVYLDVSLETVLERLDKVIKGEDPNRKRAVDKDFLVDTWHKTQELKPFYKQMFSNFVEIKATDGLTDKMILKSYNKMQSFFGGDKNPLAERNIQKIRDNNGTVMTDGATDKASLKRSTELWYKS